MPTKSDTVTKQSIPSNKRVWHPVEYRDGAWRCALTDSVSTTYSAPYNSYSKTRARTWVNSTPWPVPEGQLKPVNPYTQTITETFVPVCSWDNGVKEAGAVCKDWHYYTGSSPTDGACNVGSAGVTDQQRKYWLIDRAMLAFLLKVKDQKSQLLVTLAERKQTMSMITKLAKDVARMRKGLFRGMSKTARARITPQQAHSQWLEYRYGWMPLYYDAYGIAKHLASLADTRNLYPVRAVVKWESDIIVPSTWNSAYWKGSIKTRTSHRYKAMVGGFIQVTNRVERESVRAGLTNPLELLWETLPYSFVVDWFVSVGDYIEGMTALTGVSLTRCWASFQSDKGVSKWPVKTTYPTNMTITSHPPNQKSEMDYGRWMVSPSLSQVSIDSLVNLDLQKQSWKHWVDAAALLRARFS